MSLVLMLLVYFPSNVSGRDHDLRILTARNEPVAPRQGWTQQPNKRGTIDILWACFVTLFLSCWSILCINVPRPGETSLGLVLRKFYLICLCVVGPEFIFQIALGQWLSARRSMRRFRESGYEGWTIAHGFYADMGGFVLQPDNWKSFPIDAQQLHYLVTHGYVDYPEIDRERIRDKNKVDGLLRAITFLQILWFIVNVILRAAQGLAITTLELTTAAFVVCGVATAACWLHKPADVKIPDSIKLKVPLRDVLVNAGDQAARIYNRTPLDFASRKEWSFSILWAHGLHLLQKLHMAAPPATRPVDRFQNTIVYPIEGLAFVVFIVVSMVYFAIFIAAWNYDFPTRVERLLWRAASLTSLLSGLAFFATMYLAFEWYPALRQRLSRVEEQELEADINQGSMAVDPGPAENQQQSDDKTTHSIARRALSSFVASLRNNSPLKDPALDAPLKAIAVTWFIGFFYTASRGYIWAADIAELRSLPKSAYITVSWAWILPHF